MGYRPTKSVSGSSRFVIVKLDPGGDEPISYLPGTGAGPDRPMQLIGEMTYRGTIAGPWGPTTGSPFGARLCWSVTAATLRGDRIDARLAMPGADWIRLGSDGIRRQDQRLVFETVDAAIVTLSYDNALIHESDAFLQALANGGETTVDDQYMRMVAQFDTVDNRYAWLTQSLFIGAGRVAGDHEIEYLVYRLDLPSLSRRLIMPLGSQGVQKRNGLRDVASRVEGRIPDHLIRLV